jgi:two-component sensor histidine kinase
MRSAFFILAVLLTHFLQPAAAQEDYPQKITKFLQDIRNARSDSARADLLAGLANVYYNNREKIKNGMDSALLSIDQSIELGRRAGNNERFQKSTIGKVTLLFVAGHTAKAIAALQTLNDTNQVKSFCSWGDQFLYGTYGMQKDLTMAISLYQQAMDAGKGKSPTWRARAPAKLAILYFIKKDTTTGKKYATLAEACYKDLSPGNEIGNMWYNMAKALDTVDSNYPTLLAYYQKSKAIFHNLKNEVEEAWVLMRIADIHNSQGDLDLAEKEYLQVVSMQKNHKQRQIYSVYIRMYDLYVYKNELNTALYYALEALKSAETFGVRNLELFYLDIGTSYFNQGHIEKSIEHYQKALASARASDKIIHGALVKRMAKALVIQGKPEEALRFVLSASSEFRNFSNSDLMIIAEAKGNCYYALQQNEEAEKCYQQMLEFAKNVPLSFSMICPFAIGKFYFETNRYAKAAPHLISFLRQPAGIVPAITTSEAHLMLYKIDSANQQYPSALEHFRLYKQQTDSLFNTTRSRQIAELQIKYDMEGKDKDLLLKDQAIQLKEKDIELLTKQKLLQQSLAEQQTKDVMLKQQSIDLLTQQASLQQVTTEKQEHELVLKENDLKLQRENIGLLRNRDQLQQAQLKQAATNRKITYAGIVLLVIIVGLLYNQYRLKQRNNREISRKNDELQGLLEEKEWLLKEVHHRVKNNLQVVLSLLESQSAFLKDEALLAINDSQHRVQAMSLIHQKLYQSDNITTIDMDVYIPELVQYLKDSFNLRQAILFRLEVDPVQLDVAQAIPLGLILNEAITNAIKHAFTGRENGMVCISLKQLSDDDFVLDIADNGIGLPEGYEHKRKGSLGMRLMRGLSGDFNAEYTIESAAGTHISVAFSRNINAAGERKRPVRNKTVAAG